MIIPDTPLKPEDFEQRSHTFSGRAQSLLGVEAFLRLLGKFGPMPQGVTVAELPGSSGEHTVEINYTSPNPPKFGQILTVLHQLQGDHVLFQSIRPCAVAYNSLNCDTDRGLNKATIAAQAS